MNAPIRPIRNDDDNTPEWVRTNGLTKWIAGRRREMGEARWQQLMSEWDA
jgi:hypothetical protein